MTQAVIQDMIDRFRQKAELVQAKVSTVGSMREAFEYAADICVNKSACQLLVSGCTEALSAGAEELCEMKEAGKLICAPALAGHDYEAFQKVCDDKGIKLVAGGMRDRLAGIDIGFTVVDYGIAETGSLVLDSSSEEVRLATMISEIHVAVLKRSTLRATSFDLKDELKAFMMKKPNYLAFITGASRTADIERVLAIGVHGPLELHILILED